MWCTCSAYAYISVQGQTYNKWMDACVQKSCFTCTVPNLATLPRFGYTVWMSYQIQRNVSFSTLTFRKQKADISYVLLTFPFHVLPDAALHYISYFNSFLEAGRPYHEQFSSSVWPPNQAASVAHTTSAILYSGNWGLFKIMLNNWGYQLRSKPMLPPKHSDDVPTCSHGTKRTKRRI